MSNRRSFNMDESESLAYKKIYLYKNGNEYISNSGGWLFPHITTNIGGAHMDSTNLNSLTVTRKKNSDNIMIEISGKTNSAGFSSVYTSNLIDLSKYNTIHIRCILTKLNNAGNITLRFHSNVVKDMMAWDNSVASPIEVFNGYNEINISHINTPCHLTIGAAPYDTTVAAAARDVKCLIYEVYLSK